MSNRARPEPRLAGLLPAAGAATRFGGPKQLACVGAEPLVRRAARQLLGCCGAGVVAVTGAHAAAVERALVGLGVSCVRNPDWELGLGGSIAVGVRCLPAVADAVLILLPDQAGVEADDLRRLVSSWRGQPGRVVAAEYAGGPRVPAIFPRTRFGALAGLAGDRGAKALLAHEPRLVTVAMPGAALDVDTPEDLARLRRAAPRR